MFKKITISTLFVIVLSGCFEKEVFPVEPRIAFEDVSYDRDELTISLSFSFEDGDADIGFDEIFDVAPPFHFADAIFDADTLLVTDTSAYNPPYLAAPISFLPREVRLGDGLNKQTGLPLFRTETVFEYQRVGDYVSIGDSDPILGASPCDDFLNFTFFFPLEVSPNFDDLSSFSVDALIAANDNYYNFFVEFLEQLPSGEVVVIDFENELGGCVDPLNGRMPVFDIDADQGTITYDIFSVAFREIILGLNPIQLKFYIKDRALNQSNVDSTGFFFLEDVRIN